ncbi:small subunit ribosomal protein S6 [Corynebacterium aquatimens]|uniref:Small ribosomal subunit protein bS6 n=1 Tax=Corynebacterium aquatimens TaxID=1190508 RepID=A0A931E382_9CORY|nr:30S ribosomal protein S6 [Corynebacterium aquatimens]MBG6122785.1 small subunit ribosomal protein S6 [Corynebacterium aquatimens]
MRSVRHYEVMIILDPSQDERTVAPSLDKFLEIVRNDNGKVENVDVWGKRRLAYPIDKKEEGVYAVVNLDCTSETVLELDRRLNLSDSILRTKVLRTDNK